MLRLLDARTGSLAEVRTARPDLLRIRAHEPGRDGAAELTAARILLVADLLARVAELRGMQALTAIIRPGSADGYPAAVEAGAAALGVRPPAGHLNADDDRLPPGGTVDVHVAGEGFSLAPGCNGILMTVGAVHREGDDSGDAASARHLPAGLGPDPLAVRLALLSFPYYQPAELSAALLSSMSETLGRWRHRVAAWAESPSRPMPGPIRARVSEAFDRLDTVAVLELLDGLAADDSVPAGAKFESFLLADRVLGLELAREIGQPRHLSRSEPR